MKESFQSFLKHLWIFLIIEIIFVLLLFRELPETSLYTLIGILHLSYRLILVIAGRVRNRVTRIWQKFICTYLPIIYHLAVHLYVGWAAVEAHGDEHNLTWLIVWALLLWGLIWGGEWYLHRALHCQTHHVSAHKHCQDDCEHKH